MPKRNPLINLALNLILSKYLGEQPRKSTDQVPELGDVPVIKGLRSKDGAVILVLGRRESGKTILSQRLAEVIGRPVYAVSPEEKPPPWITELKLEQLNEEPPPYSTLVLDDLPVYASQRDYNSAYVQILEKLIPVCRHKRKLILIFSAQSSGLSDRWVMDSDVIFLKPANLLFLETERPSVAKFYRTVMPLFDKMSEAQQKRHCYLLSQACREMVRIDLPHTTLPGG